MRRILLSVGIFLTIMFPTIAAADIKIYCGALPGCNGGFPEFFTSAVMVVLQYLPQYMVALCGLFVIIGGMYMILNMGNDQQYETGKKTVIAALGGLAIAMFANDLVTYVLNERYMDPTYSTFTQDTVLGILYAAQRIILTFFNVALIAAVLYNSVRLIVSRGKDEEYTKAINGFFYAAIGAIVINVASRLVTAVMNFFAF